MFVAIPTAIPETPFNNNIGSLTGRTEGSCNEPSKLGSNSTVSGFEEIAGGGGRQSRTAIVVTEIPYQVNKAQLIEKIADLVKDQRITGISDIRDESDREGMRIVIELET